MKLFWMASLAALGVVAATAQESSALSNPKDKVSYSIGVNIGTSLKKQELEINPDQVAAGLKDVLSGGKTKLTEEEVKEVLTAFSKELNQKQLEKAQVAAEKNKTDGEKFLTENKAKEGIKTTASGLQYKVVKEGTGKKPTANDTVTTHYRGTLIDGTEFDSSYKRNEPATFPVSGVIKGWTEALQLMPVGSKWQLFIPSELAYGEAGTRGGPIGPNATLIFDIELLSIEAGDAEKKL
ncbi:MAG: FKBP-type peptidyl-prolyl cis-trans isomerase [Verrucomicrobiota bacterium]|jgi:FKBP-type peptidyl-prolyl cis-trans isomerase FklB